MKKTAEISQKNIIGANVRRLRMRVHPAVTQEDLAGRLAALGVSIVRSGIAKIENGERYVLDYEASALAKALRVPIERLYERTRL